MPPPTLCSTSPASTRRVQAVGHARDEPRVEQLGLQRRHEQARELAIARRRPSPMHDRAAARRVVAVAAEALLAVPVRRAGRLREPRRGSRCACATASSAHAAHAQHEAIRAHVAGAQLVRWRATSSDRDVVERERARPPRAATGGGSDSHCRVTAWRSFMPATPMSRALDAERARDRARPPCGVVSPRFSIRTNT